MIFCLNVDSEKVAELEYYNPQVQFQSIDSSSEMERVFFDCIGQTAAVESRSSLVENTIKALTYTQCDVSHNRICLNSCYEVRSDFFMRAIREGPNRGLPNKALECYNKEIVIGVKTNCPGQYKPEPSSMTSGLQRISKDEDLFLGESGAKWQAETLRFGVTALVFSPNYS